MRAATNRGEMPNAVSDPVQRSVQYARLPDSRLRCDHDLDRRLRFRYLHDPDTDEKRSPVLRVFRTSALKMRSMLPRHRFVGAVWVGIILGALLVFVVNVSMSIYAMRH